MRRWVPFWMAWTLCRLGYHLRLVLMLEWLTLCPTTGLFPQISHARAIECLPEEKQIAGIPPCPFDFIAHPLEFGKKFVCSLKPPAPIPPEIPFHFSKRVGAKKFNEEME